MRRITYVDQTREECLQRAQNYEWRSQDTANRPYGAFLHEQARKWRSLALIAKPKSQEEA